MEDDVEWEVPTSSTHAPQPTTNSSMTSSPGSILDLEVGLLNTTPTTESADSLLTFSENDLQLVSSHLPSLFVNQSPLDTSKEERKDGDDYALDHPTIKKQKITQQRKFEETPEESKLRFLMELEFVQCLANPQYLHFLAQGRYFQDQGFIQYIKYLQYWQKPEFAKYLVYPHCLQFLKLLQDEHFRKSLSSPACILSYHLWFAYVVVIESLHQQQFYHWQHYRNNRLFSKENK